MTHLCATILVTLGLLTISVDAAGNAKMRCSKTATHMTMTFTAVKDSAHQKLITLKSLKVLQTSNCESVKIATGNTEILQIIIVTELLSRKQTSPDPSTHDCFIKNGDAPTQVKYLVAAERQPGMVQHNDKIYILLCDSTTANGDTINVDDGQPVEPIRTTTVETTTADSTSIHGDRNMFTAAIIAGYVMTVLTVTGA